MRRIPPAARARATARAAWRGFALALILATVALVPVSPAAVETERAIVRFDDAVHPLPAGARVVYAFASEPALVVEAPRAVLAGLASVARVEPDAPIEWLLDTATVASGARDVFDPAFGAQTAPMFDAFGRGVTGEGVGIAIVDTGIDGTHPDLLSPGKLAGNWLVTPAGLVPSPYTVEGHAHGTHVAGIAAGTGEASGGRFVGAAPGASLYGFAIAPAGSVVFPTMALDWILQHGARLDPPIRVVSNSWGCASGACAAVDGDRLHVTLASRLAEAGIVVVWAVGNDGGDGFAPATNVESRNPTPGVIGVAAYDDDDRGLTFRCAASFSSRGAADDPATWPDVAAPGSRIMSTYAIGADANTRSPAKNAYRQMSGTSMAAPHVAGIAALMLQANPALAPAEVEFVLKSTARKLACGVPYAPADPLDTLDGANHVDGHGLVDAMAATSAAVGFAGIPPMPPATLHPDGLGVARYGVRATDVYYLSRGGMSPTPPPEGAPTVAPMLPNRAVVHEGAPLPVDLVVGGVEVVAYVGTLSECPCIRLTAPRVVATVEAFDAAGATRAIATQSQILLLAPTAGPVLREFVVPLDAPVVVPAGERLRVSLVVTSPSDADAASTWFFYSGSRLTPSRLLLGDAVRAYAGQEEGCQVRHDCARIGGERNHAALYCGLSPYRVAWEGPPGSGALIECNGSVAGCIVPEGAWGSCEAAALFSVAVTGDAALCSYVARGGAPPGGTGRCEAIVPDG